MNVALPFLRSPRRPPANAFGRGVSRVLTASAALLGAISLAHAGTAQTITFTPPASENFGTTPTITATSTSSLTVTFTSQTTSVCTITSGGTLSFLTTGTCTIDADQAGNGTYDPAPTDTESFPVLAVVADPPVITGVSAGDTQATVHFTAPPFDGGTVIDHYTATSNPGGITGTCGSSPCTVSGLMDGTPYTFTVTAHNSAGDGAASGASGSVTPNPGPAVVSVAVPADGTYVYGQNLDFMVSWDSNITVTGTPQLQVDLNTGGPVYADYVSQPTATTMLFRYSIASGKLDGDGIGIATSALSLNGGTIQSTSGGIDATLTLTSIGSTTNILLDSVTPTLPTANIVVDNQLDPQLILLTFVTGNVLNTSSQKSIDSSTLGAPADWVVTSQDGSITFVPVAVSLSGSPATIVRLTLPSVNGGDLATMVTDTQVLNHLKVTPPTTLADTAGDTYTGGLVSENGATNILDATPPTISAMSMGSPTQTGGTLTATTSEKVRAFWLAVPQGSTAPSEAQVKAGANYGGVTISAHGVGGLASGAAVTMALTGLTAGTNYTIYLAANDAAGNAAGTVLNADFTTDSPPHSGDSNPPNPFNSGGSQATVNLGGGSGITPVKAPSNLVTNLGSLGNQVGISDNGVLVVLDNNLNQPIKFQDNPPDNVLITMPSQKPVSLQISSNTLTVQTDSEVKNSGTQTLLNTQTLTLSDGTQAHGLEVTQGQATLGSSAANGLIGGLQLSSDTTLRSVTAQAGSSGGTAGFMKLNDGSGSISADSGEIKLYVKLANSPTTTRDANLPVSVTLESGEVARFDAQGNLSGVFLGSVSGAVGKTGDPKAVSAPAGLISYPTSVTNMEGGNVLGRFGATLSTATATDSLSHQQGADGTYRAYGNGQIFQSLLPLQPLQVKPDAADNATYNADGSITLTQHGIQSTYMPALDSAAEFAAALTPWSLRMAVLSNGLVDVSDASGVSHILVQPQPLITVSLFTPSPGFNSITASSVYYTFSDGGLQGLSPAFRDLPQFSAAAAKLGWVQQPLGSDHLLTFHGPDGMDYVITPAMGARLGSPTDATSLGQGFYFGADGKLYFSFDTGYLPMLQQFYVEPK